MAWSWIGAGIAWSAVLALVAPPPADAAGIRDHQRITRLALGDDGWTDGKRIEHVVQCNLATDMARLHAVYREPLALFFPETGCYVDVVLDLAKSAPFNDHGTAGFHFNDLYSYSAIETRWREFATWVDSTAAALSASPPIGDTYRTLALLGITTHTVQDFYSHSNWVQLLDTYTLGTMIPGEFPLWEELVDLDSAWIALHPGFDREAALARLKLSDGFTSARDDAGGLQTGKARGAPPWGGKPPWKHRHLEDAAKAVVDSLSTRASERWIRRIESHLDNPIRASYSVQPATDGGGDR